MSARKPKAAPVPDQAQPGIHDNVVQSCLGYLLEIRRLLDDIRMQDTLVDANDDILEILIHIRSVEMELCGLHRSPRKEVEPS